MHKSIVTIESPQFINLQPLDINPLMSACEVKVLYLGENRNGSFIDKETATNMAKTLRGAPIVGYWKKDAEDFADHGNQVIIDDEGVKFKCLTVPYGFVSPDAKVWFQTFEDVDDFGNTCVREYLMTTGYLWTGQFEECKVAVEEGRPHSMELDEETLSGHWANNPKNGMDFFIINDAVFSKLCILGDSVEPCFEGSSVTAPKVSLSFTKVDDGFKKTLYDMMQDLQFALRGGSQMEDEVILEPVTETTEEVVETPVVDYVAEDVQVAEDDITDTSNTDAAVAADDLDSNPETSFKKEDEEDENKDGEGEEAPKKEDNDDDKSADDQGNSDAAEEEDEEKKKAKAKCELLEANYAELETNYSELQNRYSELESKYNELVAFKAKVDDAEKDAMIAKFSFLSDEEKKDVIENKASYTVEDIENKLSVICVRNKINFSLEKEEVEEKDIYTYNLNHVIGESKPAWVKAVLNQKNKK